MEILVCVKRVPDTSDAEVILRPDGKGIKEEDLAFGINEWDNYAVEEAIRIKEAHGGKVTVATIGSSDSEDVLRRCLAMGADEAVMIEEAPFRGSDPYGIARGLRGAVFERLIRSRARRRAGGGRRFRHGRPRARRLSRLASCDARHLDRDRGGEGRGDEGARGRARGDAAARASRGPHDPDRHQRAPVRVDHGNTKGALEGDSGSRSRGARARRRRGRRRTRIS